MLSFQHFHDHKKIFEDKQHQQESQHTILKAFELIFLEQIFYENHDKQGIQKE